MRQVLSAIMRDGIPPVCGIINDVFFQSSRQSAQRLSTRLRDPDGDERPFAQVKEDMMLDVCEYFLSHAAGHGIFIAEFWYGKDVQNGYALDQFVSTS